MFKYVVVDVMVFCCLWLLLSPFPVAAETATTTEQLGRIEGTCFIGKTPCVDQEMILTRQFGGELPKESPRIKTDGKGYFVYDNLEPGYYLIGRFEEFGMRSGSIYMPAFGSNYTRHVKVEPGQTVTVNIGGAGRKVTGKLIAPEDTTTSLGWQGSRDRSLESSFKWPQPPDELSVAEAATWYEEFRKSEQFLDRYKGSFYARPIVEKDGSFWADDIPPGEYRLRMGASDDDNEQFGVPAASLYYEFTVPPGEDGSIYDLGSIPVKLLDKVAAGAVAPDFEATTLHGQTIRLSDYKGKYVLLNLWSSWYFYYNGEMSTFKQVYEQCGKEPDFVMISICLDENRNWVEKLVTECNLEWPHCWVGKEPENESVKVYDLFSRIYLISPDGKIEAFNIRGDEILTAVARALK